MSNAIYGFVEFIKPQQIKHQELVSKLENEFGLGVSIIRSEELYNFPETYMPGKDAFIFSLSDRPGSHNATYLVDGLDYAPEADFGLPNQSVDRLNILLDFIDSLFGKYGASRVCLAINECAQIDGIVKINRDDLRKKLMSEFEIFAPPDTLLDILS